MKTALIIRHAPFEGPGAFRAPIEAAGFVIDEIDVTDPDFGAIDLDEPDLLVLMGGPMGVYEVDRHPWIASETTRLTRRILMDRPTLGVCLGSQMIAAAMGARVYPGLVKEVGFAPITLTTSGRDSPLRHIEKVPVLHWHGDTFDLPGEVELLGSTATYAHQAFRRGDSILALQCHPEMGDEPFDEWLVDVDDYLALAGTSATALMAEYEAQGPSAAKAGKAMIADWLARLNY